MFRVPSTPDYRRRDDDDNPSTTPAGPPPTGLTRQSFTPKGNPPSSVFGSSFASKPPTFSKTTGFPAFGAINNAQTKSFTSFAVPSSSPPGRPDDSMDEDPQLPLGSAPQVQNGQKQLNGHPTAVMNEEDDMIDFQGSPRAAKRSRVGDNLGDSLQMSRMLGRDTGREPRMPKLVDSLVAGMESPATLSESDTIISETEATLRTLDEESQTEPIETLEMCAGKAAHNLCRNWYGERPSDSLPASIGPADKSPLAQAIFVASLLLTTHHSLTATSAAATGQDSPWDKHLTVKNPHLSFPRAFLDWLNRNHNPFPEDLVEVKSARPSPTAHERFWDTVFQSLLRGHLDEVIKLLSNANWTHAESAIEDGYEARGYQGADLAAVKEVIGQCVNLLRSCPAVTDNDWSVSGTDWQLFRSRTRRALEDLEDYAEGDKKEGYNNVNAFTASARGSFAAGSRRAESRVPWHIYEQLKALYGQLLGAKEEILLSAQDWLEATLYLAVWWDGEEVEFGRRSGYGRQRTRLVDLNPAQAYQNRLLAAFASVTDQPEDAPLDVNKVDPIQVAIGAVFEEQIESVLKILQKWSPLVAAAVVEVATVGGWMPEGRPRTGDMMDAFDQEDLMVLSHGQPQKKESITRDSLLTNYAELLAKKDKIGRSGGHEDPGWEVAIRVLSRLDNVNTAQKQISEIFDRMKFSTTRQVDEALALCNELGLSEQTRLISERYADSLASNSQAFGSALLYYARAHSVNQLQSTVDLLLSTSLVRSSAYPTYEDIDEELEHLLQHQKEVLSQLAKSDVETAKLLATKLSGYASLRRFYDLRDELELGDDSPSGKRTRKRSGMSSTARRKEMVKAIVALIESGSESVRGGLYDADAQGVVQVDALLGLLGEALPLLSQTPCPFTKRQLLALLRAAEDLQTVSSRVYERSEALFQACMADYHSGGRTEPQDLAKSLLAKSTSNLSGSSYGMVNSKGSIESEKAKAEEQGKDKGGPDDGRNWDWRRGIALVAGKAATGSDVIRLLRVGVAKELGAAWAGSA